MTVKELKERLESFHNLQNKDITVEVIINGFELHFPIEQVYQTTVVAEKNIDTELLITLKDMSE